MISLETPGGVVSIRPTTQDDLIYVCSAENAEENRRYVSQQTPNEHQTMFANPDIRHLIVEHQGNKVGYMIMAGFTKSSRSIELRRLVVVKKGKGFGRAALKLAKLLAFEQSGAHRLWLDVVDYNSRAQHLYRSEGFVQEGVLRECDYFEGKYNSLVIMSILEHEYQRAD